MSPSDPPSRGPRLLHTLADHALGALADHVHAPGEDHDHDHDHDAMDGLLDEAGGDHVVLTSIGVDVGSAGTQIAFARLHLERQGDGAAARMSTRRRETIYQSPVMLTPYAGASEIDAGRLGALLGGAFDAAGLDPDRIDCGVVILTGTALARDNAEAITRRLAEDCGDIVSAAAGHRMEARLAAHGSGAVRRSAATGKRLLNVDIGGGTTKLAICDAGRVSATAALAIGGRLVVVDGADRIVRLEPDGMRHAARAGLDWRLGGPASQADIARVASLLADDLAAALATGALPSDLAWLQLTPPLPAPADIAGVMFSGGVAEYVYGREARNFGDLGLALGGAIAARIDAGRMPWPLLPAAECIRATVLGASEHSVQLSGRTGCISNPAVLLPRRNLPVVQPVFPLPDRIDAAGLAQAIRACLAASDVRDDGGDVVLALRWHGLPEHSRLRAVAEGVAEGMAARIAHGLPLYVIVDGDIAGSLGAVLAHEIGVRNDLLVLDGIALAELDYVDLGRLRMPSETVPVTIKTLVFREEEAVARRRRRR